LKSPSSPALIAPVGHPYGELVRWVLDGAPPASVTNMMVRRIDIVADNVAIALSGLAH
jgi:hypothetical protein